MQTELAHSISIYDTNYSLAFSSIEVAQVSMAIVSEGQGHS